MDSNKALLFTTWCVLVLSWVAEGCIVRVVGINCTRKEITTVNYTCQANLKDDCLCVFENPSLTDLGWHKLCKDRNDLVVKKKRVTRQARNHSFCRDLQPPRPGTVSCHASRHDITCIGQCKAGYKFEDESREQAYVCRYSDGVWRPGTTYPDCLPDCNPPCKNSGICTAQNVCSCSKVYRGSNCQFAYELCGIKKKVGLASSWKCNFTRQETMCDVSCHPPGSLEAESEAQRYSCSVDGSWSPPLPSCVEIVGRCEDPGPIKNGDSQSPFQTFPLSSWVEYGCHDGYDLASGDAVVTCLENGTWSPDRPRCVRKMRPHTPRVTTQPDSSDHSAGHEDYCPRPNAPKASEVYITLPDDRSLPAYFNSDIPLVKSFRVKLNSSADPEAAFSTLSLGAFPLGTRVQYKCNSRFYKLYGSEYQTCLPSRTWSGHQPACVPECGRSDSPKAPFVVNGKASRVGQWPWMAGLAVKKTAGLQLMCGGVLVSESWVLTAAHCVTRPLSNVPLEARDVVVFCGKHFRRFDIEDDGVQAKQAKQIIVNDEYHFSLYDADIALVQLESPVQLTTRVQPICLPTDITTRENIRDGQKGMVLGWGLTENGTYSEALRETELPVVGHDRCEAAYRSGLRTITVTGNMFCAGFEGSASDTCHGDSGGPFMFAGGPPGDRRWHLEGLVSWGSETGCAMASRFSGFTRVEKFVPWINMFI